MKKILPILTALLFYCAATAQDEVNTSFADQMNTVFGSLDLSKVPHAFCLIMAWNSQMFLPITVP